MSYTVILIMKSHNSRIWRAWETLMLTLTPWRKCPGMNPSFMIGLSLLHHSRSFHCSPLPFLSLGELILRLSLPFHSNGHLSSQNVLIAVLGFLHFAFNTQICVLPAPPSCWSMSQANITLPSVLPSVHSRVCTCLFNNFMLLNAATEEHISITDATSGLYTITCETRVTYTLPQVIFSPIEPVSTASKWVF